MKRVVLLSVVAALLLFAAVLWFFSGPGKVLPYEYLSIGIVVLLVGFALFAGYKRLISLKRGEPAEDEMSKRVMKNSSSLSYYISIYLWLVIGHFSGRMNYETHTVIGIGIVGMAIIFLICWLVFNFRGVRNE